MKIHLSWMRVTASAVASAAVMAGVGIEPATAQYAPYRPFAGQSAAPAAAPATPGVQAPNTPYTAYRPQAQYQAPATGYPSPSTTAYQSPTGSQYSQPTSSYPQYPQTAAQYPSTYGAYPYVAQQPTEATLPAPKQSTSAAQLNGSAAMNGAASGSMSAAQPGAGCGCNGAANYGASEYYSTAGCGCNGSGGYPDCGINNYFGGDSCSENQWFGGIYFLEMGRTNATPVKLTAQIPGGTAYPYFPAADTTVMTNRDVSFDFREGIEARVGSTFTIGEPCNACQSPCGYNTGCGCNPCAPQTTYAWEVAWWGINDSPNVETVVYDTDRLVGMKNFVGLDYDFNGGGAAPVNNYYGYGLPVQALGANPQVLAQRVRTDFKAQNLELNVIRFPMCDTCSTGGCGCNGGCDDKCGLGFAMYGSCGVRYFHVDDDFMYADEFNPSGGGHAYDGFNYDNNYELFYDVQVKNNLVGPQVGFTTDYCWGKWDLFCNSTFGIFDNHMSVWQRMFDGTGQYATFHGDGSNFNVKSSKDAVAFLGELRVGTAYNVSCHWRGVVAYRAVAITGLATASDQLQNDYSNRYSAGIIDSDNSVIIHGAQVGAECRY